MKLVIAEKPSVAQSIARVIGAAGRKDGYAGSRPRDDADSRHGGHAGGRDPGLQTGDLL